MMAPEHLILVIGAFSAAITAIIAAVFAGLIALKQLPKMQDTLHEQNVQIEHIKTSTNATLNDAQAGQAAAETGQRAAEANQIRAEQELKEELNRKAE